MTAEPRGPVSRRLPDPVEEPTITAERLGIILGVSTRAVHYSIERGEIPAIRVGRRVVIPTAKALRGPGLLEEPQEQAPRLPLAEAWRRATGQEPPELTEAEIAELDAKRAAAREARQR